MSDIKIKSVYGFGVNDADYPVQVKEHRLVDGIMKEVVVWQCPYHQKWKSILGIVHNVSLIRQMFMIIGEVLRRNWLMWSIRNNEHNYRKLLLAYKI